MQQVTQDNRGKRTAGVDGVASLTPQQRLALAEQLPDLTRPPDAVLQRQKGSCPHCGLRFMADDVLEVHHLDGNHRNNRYANWVLLHGHCHDQAHGTRFR